MEPSPLSPKISMSRKDPRWPTFQSCRMPWARSPRASPGLFGAWLRLPLIVRYGFAGGTTQVVYLAAFLGLMHWKVPYFGAVVVAQAIAIAYAFPLYRDVVFRAKGSLLQQLAAFLTIWWVGGAVSLLGVPLLVEGFSVDPKAAQISAQVTAMVFGFAGHRLLTFRKAHPPEAP